MPEYTYLCENCGIKFAVKCSMEEYIANPNCVSCENNKNVYRDYATDSIDVHYVYGLSECKTVGHYADKQTKKYGEEKSKKMIESFKTQKKNRRKLPKGMSYYDGKAENMPTKSRKGKS